MKTKKDGGRKKVDAVKRVRQKLMWNLWKKYYQERGNSIWHINDVVDETEFDVKRVLFPLDGERYLARFISIDFEPSPYLVKKKIDIDNFFDRVNLEIKIKISTKKEIRLEAEDKEKRKQKLIHNGISERKLGNFGMYSYHVDGVNFTLEPNYILSQAFSVMKIKANRQSLKIELPPLIVFDDSLKITRLQSEPKFDTTGQNLLPKSLGLHYTKDIEREVLVRKIFSFITEWLSLLLR